MSTVETKVNLFSVMPAPAASTAKGQADIVNRAADSEGKSFDSTLDKAREQSNRTDKPIEKTTTGDKATDKSIERTTAEEKAADKSIDKAIAAVTDTSVVKKKQEPANETAAVEEPEDEVKAAVSSGEVFTLLANPQPIAVEPETEQPVQTEDPVATPVEAIAAVEAIGQEADADSGRTPLAMLQGSALHELLPDSGNAKAASSLLNQLSGRYEGEVTIGQQANVPTGDPGHIEGLLVNTAAVIADDLVAMTAATASRALGLNQPQPQSDDGQQPLISRSDLVVENQVLDDSSALGLTNVKIADTAMSSLTQDTPQAPQQELPHTIMSSLVQEVPEATQQELPQTTMSSLPQDMPKAPQQELPHTAMNSLVQDMPKTPQQELSQAIVGMNQELKERLSNPQDDPEDRRTAIPKAILGDAGAKSPELYLTKAARHLGIKGDSVDKGQAAAAGVSHQAPQIETPEPEQVQQPQEARNADIYDIRQQIVDQVRMIRTAQTTELVIQLKPEHLGQLTMKVSVANNGAVTALFQSENAQVRAAIEGQLAQLKQELQQQGLKVDNVSVGAGLSEDFFTRGEAQGQMSQFAQQQSQQSANGGSASRRISGISGIEGVEGIEGISEAEAHSAAGVISTDAANPVNNATDTILDYRV